MVAFSWKFFTERILTHLLMTLARSVPARSSCQLAEKDRRLGKYSKPLSMLLLRQKRAALGVQKKA